ncbi:MAG: hypothetical protein ABW194_11430 [Novosphingobium sp.]
MTQGATMAHDRLSVPAKQALATAAVAVLSWAAVAWGVSQPGALTDTEGSPAAAVIGLALVPAIMAPLLLLLPLRGLRAVRAARAGRRTLARWTVTPEEMAQFRVDDAARNTLGPAYRNRWKPPRRAPAEGLDIIFTTDAVVVGGSLFPLVTTGGFRFAGVQVLPGRPLAIEFGVVETSVTAEPSLSVWRDQAVLRLPVARRARDDLPGVLRHFQQVDAREVIVDPNRFRRAFRLALVIAALCCVISAAGFWMVGRLDRFDGPYMIDVVLALTVGGTLGAPAALLVAAVAWMLHRAQHAR